ncbi:MAG: twin transmembrane helix small protein [Rhodospirillales bacterium]
MAETNPILMGLAIAAMAAVVFVLLAGVISMAVGGEFNRRYGNKLMRWRVILQLLAVLLFGAVMLLSMK